jgi:hypothetical protein
MRAMPRDQADPGSGVQRAAKKKGRSFERPF